MTVHHDDEPANSASRFDVYVPQRPYVSLDKYINGAPLLHPHKLLPICAAFTWQPATDPELTSWHDLEFTDFNLRGLQKCHDCNVLTAILQSGVTGSRPCCTVRHNAARSSLRDESDPCGAGESLNNQDLVGWVQVGVQHVPRSEDIPIGAQVVCEGFAAADKAAVQRPHSSGLRRSGLTLADA